MAVYFCLLPYHCEILNSKTYSMKSPKNCLRFACDTRRCVIKLFVCIGLIGLVVLLLHSTCVYVNLVADVGAQREVSHHQQQQHQQQYKRRII